MPGSLDSLSLPRDDGLIGDAKQRDKLKFAAVAIWFGIVYNQENKEAISYEIWFWC